MLLDAPLMAVDWGVRVADLLYPTADSAGVARSAKLVRVTRIARLLRLMRLMKLRKVLLTIHSLVDSEWVTIIMTVVKNLVTIVAVNHVLACIWYWIGSTGGSKGWVATFDMVDAELSVKYLTSVHWSFAQFTPGASPIQPYTIPERLLAVSVLALGLVIATCFVSSITSTMAAVWMANRYSNTQHLLLRKFLNQNKVSRELGSRITHYVDFILELRHKRVHISKVHFLSFLSGPLHIDLQTEIFAPTLSWHPCFDQLVASSKAVMREICTVAVTGSQEYAKGDKVFQRGKEATHMLFLTVGAMVYRFQPDGRSSPEKVRVNTGSWCVEAVLWTPWHYVGEMKALSEVDVVQVSSAKLLDICKGHLDALKVMRGYALHFWQEVHEHDAGVLTDIGLDFRESAKCARRGLRLTPWVDWGNMAELAQAEEVQAHLMEWDEWEECPKSEEEGQPGPAAEHNRGHGGTKSGGVTKIVSGAAGATKEFMGRAISSKRTRP